MKGDKDLEKTLKRQAESVLPDSNLKDGIKARLFSCTSSENASDKFASREDKVNANELKRSVRRSSGSTAKRTPRRVAYSAIAACLVVCLSLGLGLGLGLGLDRDGGSAPLGDTYVAMNINPSFGITAGADNMVKTVTALNSDAALVIYGEEFSGQPVDEVCAKLALLSSELGFLTDGGNVSVTACNDDASLQASVANAINLKISQNETLSAKNININLVSGGKSALLSSAATLGISLDGEALTAEQINARLLGYDKESIDAYVSQLTAEYAAELAALRNAALELYTSIINYQDNPNPITLAPVISNGLMCLELYNNHYGVQLNLMDVVGYMNEFSAFVEKIGTGEDVAVEAEIRDYVKLQVKISFGNEN